MAAIGPLVLQKAREIKTTEASGAYNEKRHVSVGLAWGRVGKQVHAGALAKWLVLLMRVSICATLRFVLKTGPGSWALLVHFNEDQAAKDLAASVLPPFPAAPVHQHALLRESRARGRAESHSSPR